MMLRMLSVVFAMLVALMGLSATPALAASGGPTPSPSPPASAKAVHANDWTFGANGTIIPGSSKSTAAPQADYGICRGSFGGPSNQSNSVATNVYISCSSATSISSGVALDKCVRNGGPDDFNCTTISRNRGSTTGNAFYLNVSTRSSPCKSGSYRPRAYYVQVHGTEYPDVVGNIVSVPC